MRTSNFDIALVNAKIVHTTWFINECRELSRKVAVDKFLMFLLWLEDSHVG